MKRILSIILIVIITIAIATGCNGTQPQTTPPPSPPPSPPAQTPPASPNPDNQGEGEHTPDITPPPTPIMISAAELSQIVDQDNLILIGVVSPTAALVPFSNAANPVRGSYLVWGDDFLGTNPEALSTEVTLYRVPLVNMEDLLSRAGVTAESQIVVFSSDWLSQGGYVAWQLSMMGLNVRFLDGGVAAWRDIRGATGRSNRLSGQNRVNDFTAPNYDPASFDATIDVVIEAALNPDQWVIIDARDAGEYSGQTRSGGAFGTGRIKGAVHVNWISTLNPEDDASGLLRSREELMDLYSFIGDRKVIVYCQGGVRSAHTWMVLKDLGFDVLNYDGSWIEWSYAASVASSYPKDVILDLTEEWSDNGGRI